MPQHHRFGDYEGTDAAMGLGANVRAADADGMDFDPHVMGAEGAGEREVAEGEPALFLQHQSLQGGPPVWSDHGEGWGGRQWGMGGGFGP